MARSARSGPEREEESDGRLRRSARSRERIIDAVGELIVEGNLQPTVKEVAARANVSLRTVFRHFDDIEGVRRGIQERIYRVGRPILEAPIPDGPLDGRIRALVAQRARVFEETGPFARSGRTLRWRSRFLTEAYAAQVKDLRQGLMRVLPEARELSPERQQSLELATGFEAWDRLRSEQALSVERAQAVLVDLIGLLLGARG